MIVRNGRRPTWMSVDFGTREFLPTDRLFETPTSDWVTPEKRIPNIWKVPESWLRFDTAKSTGDLPDQRQWPALGHSFRKKYKLTFIFGLYPCDDVIYCLYFQTALRTAQESERIRRARNKINLFDSWRGSEPGFWAVRTPVWKTLCVRAPLSIVLLQLKYFQGNNDPLKCVNSGTVLPMTRSH